MNNLSITIIQSDLDWENPSANRKRHDQHIASINGHTDIIVLCEMFTTGFTMNTSGASEVHQEEMETLRWMRSHASSKNAVVTGSVSVREGYHFYNRLYWVLPDGRINTYDKRHTFSMAGEDKHYHRGQSRIIEEWRGWKICPLICYDLRFPVWSRNIMVGQEAAYDLLLYVANWPAVRREPWLKLLPARAIENQCYVAGVNRTGTDANGNDYSGDSVIIDPKGQTIIHLGDGKESVYTASLSAADLSDFRARFPVLKDADQFELDGRPMRS